MTRQSTPEVLKGGALPKSSEVGIPHLPIPALKVQQAKGRITKKEVCARLKK
jgi:hypothetical protein